MYDKIECAFCGKLNLVSFGDTDNISKPDVNGCKCWNCKKVFPVISEEEARDVYGNEEIDDAGGFKKWFKGELYWFDGEKC